MFSKDSSDNLGMTEESTRGKASRGGGRMDKWVAGSRCTRARPTSARLRDAASNSMEGSVGMSTWHGSG